MIDKSMEINYGKIIVPENLIINGDRIQWVDVSTAKVTMSPTN